MERLQKVIAHAGIASRRKAESLIAAGRVKVNGKVIKEMGCQVVPTDSIEVDGVPLDQEKSVYYLFNKPRGVISAVSDDRGRKVVTDYFEEIPERIYPVGRLDYDTTGLLLLTNDGEFSQLLTHPKYEIEKTYVAKVKGIVLPAALQMLRNGVIIEGKKTAPAKVTLMASDRKKNTSTIKLTIHEGRNHQVKNMFQAIKHPVLKLTRETYGSLDLRSVKPGGFRPLKRIEIHALKELAKK